MRLVAGIALVLVGAVWFLQGIDLLGGSSMTGRFSSMHSSSRCPRPKARADAVSSGHTMPTL